jgi:hypothetical protein
VSSEHFGPPAREAFLRVTAAYRQLVVRVLLLYVCLSLLQVAARRFKTPHHYKTLGLAMGATEADIRK